MATHIRFSETSREKIVPLWVKLFNPDIPEKDFSLMGAIKKKLPSYEKMIVDIVEACTDLLDGKGISEDTIKKCMREVFDERESKSSDTDKSNTGKSG